MAKKTQTFWGCWVTWKEKVRGKNTQDWGWTDTTDAVFARTRKGIMPLCREWAAMEHIKSARPKKVEIPDAE